MIGVEAIPSTCRSTLPGPQEAGDGMRATCSSRLGEDVVGRLEGRAGTIRGSSSVPSGARLSAYRLPVM